MVPFLDRGRGSGVAPKMDILEVTIRITSWVQEKSDSERCWVTHLIGTHNTITISQLSVPHTTSVQRVGWKALPRAFLSLQRLPKYLASTSQTRHHLRHLRSPALAPLHPSYSSTRIGRNDPRIERQVVVCADPRYDRGVGMNRGYRPNHGRMQ